SRVSSFIHDGTPGVRERTSMTPMRIGVWGANDVRRKSPTPSAATTAIRAASAVILPTRRRGAGSATGAGARAGGAGGADGARGSGRRRDRRDGRGGGKCRRRVGSLWQRDDRTAAQQRLTRIAVEHEREPRRRPGALGISATLGARRTQRLANRGGLEHAAI